MRHGCCQPPQWLILTSCFERAVWMLLIMGTHSRKSPMKFIEIHYSKSPLNLITRKQPNAFELGVRPSQWFTKFIGVVSNFGVPKSHGSTKNAGCIPPFRQTHRKWRVFFCGWGLRRFHKWTGWNNLKVGREHMVESGYLWISDIFWLKQFAMTIMRNPNRGTMSVASRIVSSWSQVPRYFRGGWGWGCLDWWLWAFYTYVYIYT